MRSKQVSVIVNAHREGLILSATLASVENAIAVAMDQDITVDALVVIDKGDELTHTIVEEWCAKFEYAKYIDVEHGDLGLSRNTGVQSVEGVWVAFIDGDDLFGRNWLSSAYGAASADKRTVVWHPEINIYFGAGHRVFHHVDMDSPQFHISALSIDNHWTALCFVKRSLVASLPYRAIRIKDQIGYEDWTWAIDAVHEGAIHKVVPGTAHAIRQKSVSLVEQTKSAGCVPGSTTFFRDLISNQNGAGAVA